MRIGDYVYDYRIPRKNLLVLKITLTEVYVYCMKTNDKFWIERRFTNKTPIPWKNK